MAIPDFGTVRDPIDAGIDGQPMDSQQKGRYFDMIKVACLDFHQNKIDYKKRSFS